MKSPQSSSRASFAALPVELQLAIFEQCDYEALFSLSLVTKDIKALISRPNKRLDPVFFRTPFDLKALLAHAAEYKALDAKAKKAHGGVVKFHPLVDFERQSNLHVYSDWDDVEVSLGGKKYILDDLTEELKANATEPPVCEIQLQIFGEDWDADVMKVLTPGKDFSYQPAKILIRNPSGTPISVERFYKGILSVLESLVKRFDCHPIALQRLEPYTLQGFKAQVIDEKGRLHLLKNDWLYD